MTDTDQERENEVLKRMLRTPHKPHREKGKADATEKSDRSNRKIAGADNLD